ncbi:PLP-dependent aminotransferase family protein [Siccirubricoccus sp. G192]|uniref:MocR-like pyridoxine biosynthesis transcription factor PdxR n=1 Tax=Siccirubricoccus sp. G192 TaxID=2849651 RepID=UPI001C2BDE72|nr:PLP-dependent aminotransferase family protein [Siccirubricoccus sp. G192]MBV1796603.1 PLP-dependent aminotransferase family protein [Siccirubricoccus sp. G192]
MGQGSEPGLDGITLGPRQAGPIYRQIHERIRSAILDGHLPPGTRLPSWNSLAGQLGVARGTVKAAYDWLAGEGYVVGRGPAGTLVNPDLRLPPDGPGGRAAEAAPPDAAGPGPEGDPLDPPWASPARPFQPGVPAFDAFPRKLWCRLAARHAGRLGPAEMGYQDPAGAPALRAAIANYLGVARGIVCSPAQVFVTAGFAGALDLVTRALLRPGDQVWFEDPGYPRTRQALTLAGAEVVPVPVDEEGLNVEEGLARAPDARFAVVTPSCQAPLGMMLSLPRRLALLRWAARTGGWIVEDDYYGEFRLAGPPLPALKGLDAAGRVIYVGTFSKVLLPALRLGYAVVLSPETARFAQVASRLVPGQALPVQKAVADFITEGHLGRHIRRMRGLYAERRRALAAALQEACGARARVDARDMGMHLLLRLPPGTDDIALTRRAAEAGLGPVPLSLWSAGAGCGAGLMLSFTNIPAEAAGEQARRLAALLPSHRR